MFKANLIFNMNNKNIIDDVKEIIHTITGGILNEPVLDGSGPNGGRAKRTRKLYRKTATKGKSKPKVAKNKNKNNNTTKRISGRAKRGRATMPFETLAQPVPSMHSKRESVRVYHKEYLCDIITSPTANNFSAQSFPINAGIIGPWLKNMSTAYTEYKFTGLAYEFQSSATPYSTNSTIGTYAMAVQYNTQTPIPTDYNTLMESTGVKTGRIIDSALCPVECSSKKFFKVRTGALPASDDIADYDMGNFIIGSRGCATSINIGRLWVSYSVILTKPTASYGVTESSAHYQLANFDKNHFVGATREAKLDTIGLTFDNVNTITFPLGSRGTYKLSLDITGDSTANLGTIATTLVNATAVSIYKKATANHLQVPAPTSTGTDVHYETCISITDSSVLAKVIFTDNVVVPTTATQSELYVEECNINLKN